MGADGSLGLRLPGSRSYYLFPAGKNKFPEFIAGYTPGQLSFMQGSFREGKRYDNYGYFIRISGTTTTDFDWIGVSYFSRLMITDRSGQGDRSSDRLPEY